MISSSEAVAAPGLPATDLAAATASCAELALHHHSRTLAAAPHTVHAVQHDVNRRGHPGHLASPCRGGGTGINAGCALSRALQQRMCVCALEGKGADTALHASSGITDREGSCGPGDGPLGLRGACACMGASNVLMTTALAMRRAKRNSLHCLHYSTHLQPSCW